MKKLSKSGLNFISFPVGSYQCNCSVVYSEESKEAIIIDPGNDLLAIKSVISNLKITPKLLLHTHAHFDHIGQSSELKKETNAKMLLHADDNFLYEKLPEQGLFFGQKIAHPSPIDQFISDGESFGLSDKGLHSFFTTIHTPGHTPGSCCFYSEFFDEPILLSGDTLFSGSIGRTDLPGGDMNKILKSIEERLFNLPLETIVTPGHGEETTINREKKSNPFFN